MDLHLESEDGLWVVLSRTEDGRVLGRFAVDPSEVRQIALGGMAFQATDGQGNSVNLEGEAGGLKIRVESRDDRPIRCRIDPPTVESMLKSLNLGV